MTKAKSSNSAGLFIAVGAMFLLLPAGCDLAVIAAAIPDAIRLMRTSPRMGFNTIWVILAVAGLFSGPFLLIGLVLVLHGRHLRRK